MCLVNWNVCESLENINIKAARLVQKLACVSELYYSEEKLSSVRQSVSGLFNSPDSTAANVF